MSTLDQLTHSKLYQPTQPNIICFDIYRFAELIGFCCHSNLWSFNPHLTLFFEEGLNWSMQVWYYPAKVRLSNHIKAGDCKYDVAYCIYAFTPLRFIQLVCDTSLVYITIRHFLVYSYFCFSCIYVQRWAHREAHVLSVLRSSLRLPWQKQGSRWPLLISHRLPLPSRPPARRRESWRSQ